YPFFPRFDHVAGADPGGAALAVEADVDDEVTAGHQGDARVLFVNRVALDEAAVGPGVLQETRPVPDFHRLKRNDTGTDDLAAATVAGHQVRLDQAGGDLQVGAEVAAVEPDRHAVGRLAQVVMLLPHLAVVVLDPVVGGDLAADYLFEFRSLVGPVQPGGNEEEYVLAGHAALFEGA